jgi:hypothetical protein
MNRHTVREIAAALVVAAVVYAPVLLVSLRAQGPPAGAPDLVGMLKASPGVLGVDAGRMASGKQVIFAWFENKQAVLTWYYSDAHRALMLQFSGGMRRPAGPLADVPDDGKPVLAIASVTLAGGAPPAGAADLASVPQIAIELYTPLPGGLAVGGRFAPSSVHVPGLVEVPAAGRPDAAGQ